MNQYTYFEDRLNFGMPRITWAVQRLILINVAVFALQLLWQPLEAFCHAGFRWQNPDPFDTFFAFQVVPFLHGQIWRPITYQFLHGNLMHLCMNMLGLYFFGIRVEQFLGSRQFFRFYLICGALGVLAAFFPFLTYRALFGQVSDTGPVLGASGAFMGVLVAFVMIEPNRQFYFFPIPVPVTALHVLYIVIGLNVVSALSSDGISVTTHFGGMAVGYVYMRAIPLFNNWRRDRQREKAANQKKPEADRIGEAVDNIFRFEDRKRRP